MANTVNPLGDLRAEADHRMLDSAFVETPDFKTLLESRERSVVVGRRGTGKSAYVYRLGRHWRQDPDTQLVQLAPEEDQLIGMRALVESFGQKFEHLKAGSRIAWRYALLAEIAGAIGTHHRFKKAGADALLNEHAQRWRKLPPGASGRLRTVLRGLPKFADPSDSIGQLAAALQVNQLQESVVNACDRAQIGCAVLIDKLDEGYEPDPVGVAIMNGLIQASIDINTRIPLARSTVFVRDNIFRAVAQMDADYSRNIEGQVLRLHWDERQLMNLVANRMRMAFSLEYENDLKVWNRCTARELQGMDGFRGCLQLTLYRPRDVLALLNEAFFHARRQGRDQIIGDDVEATSKQISQSRFDDLHKEYQAIFPGLQYFTSAFAGGGPELAVSDVHKKLQSLLDQDVYPPAIQQHFRVLGDPQETTRALYSVGFLGVRDQTTGSYMFCHDGKAPTRQFDEADRILVHPCYWMALNLSRNVMQPEEAQEINDEYEIGVTSATPEIRKARLGALMGRLDRIAVGEEGALQFEEWCLESIRMLWAGHLRNIELHPNRNAAQRRDVVGTNLSEKGAFKRILQDYGSRQVVFEVKNYSNISASEFRQMLSYLDGEYGRCGFVITRDTEIELRSGAELEWVRELYNRHPRVLILRLTGRWLAGLLSKLRSPAKHDQGDEQLNKLLDTYVRLYMGGQSHAKPAKRRKK